MRRGLDLRLGVTLCAVLALTAIGLRAFSQTPQSQDAPAPTVTPKPTGAIVGRVVDGVTNTPIAGATVTLSGGGVAALRVIVDPQGRFLFTSVPAGNFTLTATRASYLNGNYGSLRPDGTGRTIELRSGERVTYAVIRLWRYGAISGTVTDDAGDAVPFARVQAMKRTIVAGRWRLVNSNQSAETNDRGEYRIPRLTPGEYALLITSLSTSIPTSLMELADFVRRGQPSELGDLNSELQKNGVSGFVNDLMQKFPVTRVGDLLLQTSGNIRVGADRQTLQTYPTVWYPGAATPAGASMVSVASGDERGGIDLHPTLTKTLRVSGTVMGLAGPMPNFALRLVPARLEDAAAEITSSLALSLTTSLTATDANGSFTFVGVPPGQYLIRARTATRPPPLLASLEPVLWAETPVSVGTIDTTGIVVSLRTGLHITGHAEFIGNATKPAPRDLAAIRIVMDSADGRSIAPASAYSAQVDADAKFTTTGLTAGRYLLRLTGAVPGCALKSAMLNGRDIIDVPVTLSNDDVSGLVLTFTDQITTVAGSVRDGQGRPDAEATVLIFPADGTWTDLGPSPRRLRDAPVARAGSFSTSGLPQGDYFVIAIDEAHASNWQDPAFLQKLSRLATRISLADGQSLSLSLTTAEGIVR